MKKSAGFTLIELVVVMIIVGILAVSAVSRFGNQNNFSLKADQELLIAALFQAQQLAMSGRPTQFSILSADTFAVSDSTNPSNHYDVASIIYPQRLAAGVTFNLTPLVLTYNNLGETAQTVIVIQADGDTASVQVEASGYARAL